MATKKDDASTDVQATEIPEVVPPAASETTAKNETDTPSGASPGYKIITNLQPCQQHIPLSDGTGIDLGPWLSPTRSSAPVLGKLLNKDFMKRMVHLKRIRVDG